MKINMGRHTLFNGSIYAFECSMLMINIRLRVGNLYSSSYSLSLSCFICDVCVRSLFVYVERITTTMPISITNKYYTASCISRGCSLRHDPQAQHKKRQQKKERKNIGKQSTISSYLSANCWSHSFSHIVFVEI